MGPKTDLLDLLLQIPGFATTGERRSLINFVCPSKINDFNCEGSPKVFVSHLVDVLSQQGQGELLSFLVAFASSDFMDVARKPQIQEFHLLIRSMDSSAWETEFCGLPTDSGVARTGNDLSQPHLFDMQEAHNKLRVHLRNHKKGPVGLAVDCDDPLFFDFFCQRLMILLTNPIIPREDVPLAIRSNTHGIPNALSTVTLCLNKAETNDLIVPVQVGSPPGSYLTFWSQLCTQEKIQQLNHRLVIILHLKADECKTIDPPLIALGQPVCEVGEALVWLDRVWDLTRFQDTSLKDLWEDVICCECRVDTAQPNGQDLRLDIAQMFKHIRDMMRLLSERPTQDVVKAKLMERKVLYG